MNDLYSRLKEVFLIVLIILGVALVASLGRWTDSVFPVRSVTVSAEGRSTVPPDVATTSFSVVSEGSDVEKLEMDNTEKMAAITTHIKNQGIEGKDIKTTNYNLSPKYTFDKDTGRSFIYGYTLTQSTLVKIRDFSKIGKILSGLSDLGVNQISSVSFGIEDPEKYLSSARSDAFKTARAKAEAMAAQNGMRIVRVINFSEYPTPIPFYDLAKGGATLESRIPPQPVIEPGSEEVKIQVSVTYEIQ